MRKRYGILRLTDKTNEEVSAIMVTPELIAQLKQVNVSKDKDKTAERVKSLFSAASRKDKKTIEELSNQKRTSIYRVFKTGSISAKLLLPLAEVLGVDPYYFTGEADEQGDCTDTAILQFLGEHQYKFTPPKTRKPRRTREQMEECESTPPEDVVSVTVTFSNTDRMKEAAETLDYDNAASLLNGLSLRAKAGGEAEQLWELVKLCLLA